jgi:putative transposase
MKKTQFSDEQIITILKLADAGQKVGDICRTHAISEATFYR